MVKRTFNAGDNEPEQKQFLMPSPKEHLFQVVDIFDNSYENNKFNLDENTVITKLEVVGGEEEGRTLLQRLSLDPNWKGFFFTRMFLKAIGQDYKGDITMDTDLWVGAQFFATVAHVESKGKTYANIAEYNFDKKIERSANPGGVTDPSKIAWDE